MASSKRKFDPDFREGAGRIVRETRKPIAQVARDLGINEGTLANWVNKDIEARLPRNGGLRASHGLTDPRTGKGLRVPASRWALPVAAAVIAAALVAVLILGWPVPR